MNETELMAEELVDRAIVFAAYAHKGQVRKSGGTPYVLHVMEAAAIAATMTDDREVMAAALLHDTVEDTKVKLEDIERIFGSRVAALVASETEDKLADLPPESTWRVRKEVSMRALQDAGEDIKILWMSDKLSNMRSFYQMKLQRGASMWNRFHQKDPKEHEWYYRTIAEMLSSLKDTAAYKEFAELIDKVFA